MVCYVGVHDEVAKYLKARGSSEVFPNRLHSFSQRIKPTCTLKRMILFPFHALLVSMFTLLALHWANFLSLWAERKHLWYHKNTFESE